MSRMMVRSGFPANLFISFTHLIEISLEETLPLFEEGIKLLNGLKDYLSAAEIKIEKLIKDSEGKFKIDEYRELSKRLEEEG